MFYYPQLINTPNLVNIQVVFPGGWGQLKDTEPGLHFLWENLFFAPTKSIKDTDKWLWDNTLDFWSVTSFESVRLNFTLHTDQVDIFAAKLGELLTPRPISPDFITKEITDLKHYWQTDRDQKEDAVLRALFKNEKVVHPNPELINNLSLNNVEAIYDLWAKAKPYALILGTVKTDDLVALGTIFPEPNIFKTVTDYLPPKMTKEYFTPTRWGLKVSLNQSHLFELLVIELWEQQFKAKFFFEYHHNNLYIWTNEIEHPRLLADKVKHYDPSNKDVENALKAYLKFLTKLYKGENSKSIEKLSELTEGLHAHSFQASTYGLDPDNLNLADTLNKVEVSSLKDFYLDFRAPLNADT